MAVRFEDHATEDTTGPAPTIGAYEEGAERWQFAGWCWTHDHFTEGEGTPVGWLPMLTTAEPVAQHPDDAAVDAFAEAMKAKLTEARAKGRGGWQDKADCPQQRLSDMLRAHIEKGDPRDVANFCMFLHQRGESILPVEPVAQSEADAWMTPGGDVSRSYLWCAERCRDEQRPRPLYLAAQPAQSVDVLPFDDDVQAILGRMCFQCIHLAAALRAMGHAIDKRAEAEQAAVLHWMLNHYLKHGKGWSDAASAEIEAARTAALQEKSNG